MDKKQGRAKSFSASFMKKGIMLRGAVARGEAEKKGAYFRSTSISGKNNIQLLQGKKGGSMPCSRKQAEEEREKGGTVPVI